MRPEFQAALEFAQGADDIKDAAELNRRFGEVVRPFGVRYFSTVVAAVPGQLVMPKIMFGEVDPTWSKHYVVNDYPKVDPALMALFETRKPFTWSEAAARRPSKRAERMFGEVTEITGTDEALVVPVHDRMGETTAVILSGSNVQFDPEVRPVLHLAAVYFSGVGRDITEATQTEDECPLTARQLECLRWVMDGKSDWEIGEILAISERTAHNHIEAAKRALDVGTRTQAVVQAWRRGWLV